MEQYELLIKAVMDGDQEAAIVAKDNLLAAGAKPLVIIERGLVAAMNDVGLLFKEGEIFVPEVIMASNCVLEIIEQLKLLIGGQAISKGTVVIGTVKGDLHDIGKNLVRLLLESNGFRVVDLGADVAPERFIAAAQAESADIVALSALLTTTMLNMRAAIEAFTEAGCRDRLKIIVGGAPVSPEFAAQIGADGYAENAAEAVALCQSLLK